nr:hypothetical protein [Tanacetum cinerariifolium]
MEPPDTLLIGDEDSSTNPARETNKFIKSSVDDLVPIPKESKVTSDSNLECDMPINTPFPTTDVKEEIFDINSPSGEHIVDFLMKNEDIADLPRHLVKQLFSYFVKHLSSTKRISDEPLGDDLKLRSYDVTFLNSLFDFSDDFTLCNDNLIFDEEFKDISSLDPLKSAPLNYEPLEGDILFLEHLLIEETFSNLTPAVLPKKSTLLVTPLPDYEHIFLREAKRFDPFFSLTQSGEKKRVMETPSFGFNYIQVMYHYYHPHLTSVDGFDP